MYCDRIGAERHVGVGNDGYHADATRGILRGHQVNASANRERKRQQRLLRLVCRSGVPLMWFWYREF